MEQEVFLEDPDDMTEEEWEEYMDYLYSLIEEEYQND